MRDRGTIEPGKRASLLLLGADPLASTSAFDTIEWCSSADASCPAPISPPPPVW